MMAKRFGRNQKRKMREEIDMLERRVNGLQFELKGSRKSENETNARLVNIMRDQLAKGTIPLEVEHFLSHERRNIIMHVILDERRANLHCQREISPHELKIQRDSDERERFGQYLGRAIADRIADAYAGQKDGTSKSVGKGQDHG